LVLMLVLTQMSVGAFLVDQVVSGIALAAGRTAIPAERSVQLVTAFGLGMLGLAAATFHLGRPWLAYRAIIGWRTSWLSREVIAFTAFAAFASAYSAMPWLEAGRRWELAIGGAVAGTGLAGVCCSTMIYASTRRTFWNPAYTGLKFLLTSLVLGIPVAMLMRLGAASWSSAVSGEAVAVPAYVRELCQCLLVAAVAKLLLEGAILSWLRARTFTPLRRTALLMTGDLARATVHRFACGAIGGLALPTLLLAGFLHSGERLSAATVTLVGLTLVLNFAGELLERYLFFAAVVAPKMPGAPST
jgi:DMSO reductase anchor subunit